MNGGASMRASAAILVVARATGVPIRQAMRRACRFLHNRHKPNRRNIWNNPTRHAHGQFNLQDSSRPNPLGDLTMKRFQVFQYAATAIATVGFVLPSGASAADGNPTPMRASTPQSPTILDVSLGEGGTLSGQVLNGQGAPLPKTTVAVRSSTGDSASTVTDVQGHFSIGGLRGGAYEVTCSGNSGIVRLWTADASPPSANKAVLIVAGPVARGQYYQTPCPRPLTHGQILLGTLTLGALIGGVTAWAITEHNSEHEPSS
jgi:hypothetical protein